MSQTEEIYQIADELRGIACLGLHFAGNHYDTERYERVLSLSARMVAAIEQSSPDEVLDLYRNNLGHISPIAGAEVAVFRDGKLLLIKREDDGLWALPGGLVEVGETLAQAAQRELLEETNLHGRVVKLLGIFDSRLWHSKTKSHVYHVVFLTECDTDQPVAGPETTDVGFFSRDGLPTLSPGHRERVPVVFKLSCGEIPAPYFDEPSQGPALPHR